MRVLLSGYLLSATSFAYVHFVMCNGYVIYSCGERTLTTKEGGGGYLCQKSTPHGRALISKLPLQRATHARLREKLLEKIASTKKWATLSSGRWWDISLAGGRPSIERSGPAKQKIRQTNKQTIESQTNKPMVGFFINPCHRFSSQLGGKNWATALLFNTMIW